MSPARPLVKRTGTSSPDARRIGQNPFDTLTVSKRRSRPLIEIRNPHPGGARYTSLRAATGMVERGIAAFVNSTAIQLQPIQWLRTLHQMEAAALDAKAVDSAISEYRAGRVWWNGNRGRDGIYPPGAVIS